MCDACDHIMQNPISHKDGVDPNEVFARVDPSAIVT
jgi:hypothetical protein